MLGGTLLGVAALLTIQPSAAQRLDRLVALAHLDATVRYFNPSVATSAARWDSLFAANVIAIADAPDGTEYGRRIAAMMAALGDTATQGGSPQSTLTYDGFPSSTGTGSRSYSLVWRSAPAPVSYRVELGEGAQVDVRLSSGGGVTGTVTVSPPPTAPEWRARYPSAGYRVLGAMRVWSTMRLFNPYQPLTRESWDEQLRVALAAAEQARDGIEYARTVAAFTARVHDTHVSVGGGDYRFVVPINPVGAQARLIENQLVVTRIVHPSAGEAGLKVGDVVVSVDGEAVAARMARLSPYISASTPQALRFRLQQALMCGSDGAPARLIVRDATGGERALVVPRSPTYYQGGAWKHRAGSVIRMLPGNIGYVDLERLTLGMVDSAFRVLAGTRAIIFDDRGYPLGSAWAIAPRLNVHGDGVIAAKFRRRIVPSPDTTRTTIYEFDQPIPPARGVTKYTGQTAMLIDERALSQAEHTGLFLEAANGTKFIGSPTMGSNGDVTNFMIPGGIVISFTGHDVRHADGRQLQRVGLQPDVAALPTLAGIRAGRDEVLEAAHRFLGGTGEIPPDTVIGAPPVAAPSAPAPEQSAPAAPPSGWRVGSPSPSLVRLTLDSTAAHGGRASGRVEIAAGSAPETSGSAVQVIQADAYRGQRVRLSGWVRTRDAVSVISWVRVEGAPGDTLTALAFSNSADLPITGSVDWRRFEHVLDVAPAARAIAFGVLLSGGGTVWLDDFALEPVDRATPSTNRLAKPTMIPEGAEAQRRIRAGWPTLPSRPLNLDFEQPLGSSHP